MVRDLGLAADQGVVRPLIREAQRGRGGGWSFDRWGRRERVREAGRCLRRPFEARSEAGRPAGVSGCRSSVHAFLGLGVGRRQGLGSRHAIFPRGLRAQGERPDR